MSTDRGSFSIGLRLRFWQTIARFAELGLRCKKAVRFAYPILVLLTAGTLAYVVGALVGRLLLGTPF